MRHKDEAHPTRHLQLHEIFSTEGPYSMDGLPQCQKNHQRYIDTLYPKYAECKEIYTHDTIVARSNAVVSEHLDHINVVIGECIGNRVATLIVQLKSAANSVRKRNENECILRENDNLQHRFSLQLLTRFVDKFRLQ